MSSSRLIDSLRSYALLALALAVVTGGVGCSRMWSALFIRVEEKHELAEIRHDTRRELADQREEARRQAAEDEVEQARLNAERAQWEAEFCRCNKEQEQERLRANIKETVESKLAFNVEHGLEVGELEVDVERLKEMLQQREQPPPQLPVKQRCPCPCCDTPCRCGSGFLRRHCPHCRHRHCEAEKDCGGPEALARLEQQPLKQPLRPAEIPLKLPVSLTFGVQQPQMERARIRRQPVFEDVPPPPCQPCTQPCENYYQHGLPRMPCTSPVPGNAPPPVQSQPGPPTPSPTGVSPPVPIADPAEQIRYQQLVPIQSTSYLQRLPPTEPQFSSPAVSPASYQRPPRR
jgi:hypothetical protein